MNVGSTSIGGLSAQPPYIRFETRAVERRKTIEEGGASFFVDVDYALITPHGSKDTVEKVVDEWLPRLKEDTRQGRFPPSWYDAYRASYEAWKSDQAPPLTGTDIRNWPAITPAQVKMLTDLRVVTIEILAQANEDLISRIGMGGRALKQKALDWLSAQQGPTEIVAQLASLRAQIAALEHRLVAMTARAELAEQAAVSTRAAPQTEVRLPPVEDRLIPAKDNTAELVDSSIDEELGGG